MSLYVSILRMPNMCWGASASWLPRGCASLVPTLSLRMTEKILGAFFSNDEEQCKAWGYSDPLSHP